MDQSPLWLGIYGAVVATAAIFAEIFIWYRSRKPRLRVSLEPYTDDHGRFSALVVFVINFSDFPIKAQIEIRGDQESWAIIDYAKVIEPRDHFFAVVNQNALRNHYGFWGGERVQASAHLPTKNTFHSKWVDLDQLTPPDWERLSR